MEQTDSDTFSIALLIVIVIIGTVGDKIWGFVFGMSINQTTKSKDKMGQTENTGVFVFTPENLLDNLDKLGGWSAYGLAIEALNHYFPEVYSDEDNIPTVQQELDLAEKIGCKYWDDVIVKYHTEVGWEHPFSPRYVNDQ